MRLLAAFVACLPACLSPVPGSDDDAGADAATMDVGADAARDGGVEDAGLDAGMDAATCSPFRPPERVVTSQPEEDSLYLALRELVLTPSALPGYDLDGFCTDAPSSGAECTPDASPLVTDGPGGIDNSFGRSLLPIFTAVDPDLESDLRNRMGAGETLLLRLRDWNGTLDDGDIKASLLRVGSVQRFDGLTVPQWDGEDFYDIDDRSYNASEEELVRDDVAYMVGGRVVARLPDNQPIVLPWIGGGTIGLRLVDASLTGTVSEDFMSIDRLWLQGRISIAALRSMWDAANICEGSPLRTMLDAATPAATDVMARPRSGGPGAICEAVSFAIELRGVRSAGKTDTVPGTSTFPSCP